MLNYKQKLKEKFTCRCWQCLQERLKINENNGLKAISTKALKPDINPLSRLILACSRPDRENACGMLIC